MKKIGFLFLTTIAHAMHMITIARELCAKDRYMVTLYVSTKEIEEILRYHFKDYSNEKLKIRLISPSKIHQFIRLFKHRYHPRVRYVIKNNNKELYQQTALVTADNCMRACPTTGRPIYIGVDHGAGDRETGYIDDYKCFDYLLISGASKKKRMLENNLITQETGKLIGYPKFDLTFQSPPEQFFDNNRPVVVYAPHCNRNETSWFKWGEDILDYFFNNKKFNLIFAPHILLFEKNKNFNSKYYSARNIQIDLNSSKLTDMSYMKSADIYLGDVSSQVYEFTAFKPRPCVFLNAQKYAWQDNESFRMWKMGDVVEDIITLDEKLNIAINKHKNYNSIQIALRDETFSFLSLTAGERGANAIIDILK